MYLLGCELRIDFDDKPDENVILSWQKKIDIIADIHVRQSFLNVLQVTVVCTIVYATNCTANNDYTEPKKWKIHLTRRYDIPIHVACIHSTVNEQRHESSHLPRRAREIVVNRGLRVSTLKTFRFYICTSRGMQNVSQKTLIRFVYHLRVILVDGKSCTVSFYYVC